MREFVKRTRLTQDMKKAIQRNAKLDENFSAIERQLDKEKLMTLNQLSERKREFIKERAKRRLSLPNIETTGPRSVSFGRQKVPSTDEGKDASLWLQFSDKLNFHPRSLSPSNKQDPELISVSSLGQLRKRAIQITLQMIFMILLSQMRTTFVDFRVWKMREKTNTCELNCKVSSLEGSLLQHLRYRFIFQKDLGEEQHYPLYKMQKFVD